MLHTHSFNMGIAAGLAWKLAGKPVPEVCELEEENTPLGELVLELCILTEDKGIWLPSSFIEGFFAAFSENPYYIAC